MRFLAVGLISLLTVATTSATAHADTLGDFCIWWFCWGGGNDAPVPLIGTGIGAIVAVAGGVFAARRRRS